MIVPRETFKEISIEKVKKKQKRDTIEISVESNIIEMSMSVRTQILVLSFHWPRSY